MNDEKNHPVSDQGPTTITGVRDMAAEFAQQQEQKRLDFEESQERKRQAFEIKLEKQKARREWLMLIITCAAVAATAWTAYEARRARFDAQAAMQMDERPYVKLSFKGVEDVSGYSPFEKGIKRALRSKYLLTTYGRTTALDIAVDGKCGMGQLRNPMLPTSRQPKPDIQIPIAAPTDSNDVFCSVDFDENNLAIYLEEHRFIYYGAVFYKDMFKADHMTQFCWIIGYESNRKEAAKVEQCPTVHLEIT